MDQTLKFDQITDTMNDNDIVLSGMSGRFPNCGNVDELSYNLYNKIDMITEDEKRWDEKLVSELSNRHGVIPNVSKFDANFFGIPPKQAHLMDPQSRILLEVTYEAILDSGIDPQSIRGENIGVFVAASTSDSELISMNKVTEASPLVMLG